MIRALVGMVSGVGVVLGAGLALASDGAEWQVLVWSLLVLLGVVFENARYKRVLGQKETAALPGDWKATLERSIDPVTGQRLQVMYQPATGARAYVEAGARR